MHTKAGPEIECELSYMGYLWLQRSLGRPLASLTCAVKRCQPWFVLYIFGLHGSVLMVFKSPTGELSIIIYLRTIAVLSFSAPALVLQYKVKHDIRAIFIYLSILLLCAHNQICGSFLVQARTLLFFQPNRWLNGEQRIHLKSFLLTSWMWRVLLLRKSVVTIISSNFGSSITCQDALFFSVFYSTCCFVLYLLFKQCCISWLLQHALQQLAGVCAICLSVGCFFRKISRLKIII